MALQIIPPFPLPPPDDEVAALIEVQRTTKALTPADELYVTFRSEPKKDKEASAREGRPMFRPVEYIQILTPGDKDSEVNRPVRAIDRYLYEKKYAAFRRGSSQEYGTPLKEWGGIPDERVAELAYFKITTVEALAAVNDEKLSSIGMQARKEREKARNYLEAMKTDAPISDLRKRAEDAEAKAAAVEARLAALEQLAADTSPIAGKPVETPSNVKPEKRK